MVEKGELFIERLLNAAKMAKIFVFSMLIFGEK